MRQLARCAAVLAVALAAGHLAQTLALREASVPKQVMVKAPVNIVQLSGSPADDSVTAPLLEPKFVQAPSPVHVPALPAPTTAEPLPKVVVARDCAPQMALQTAPGGMVLLSLSAPCDGGARVVLRHAGLTFTERMMADGTLALPLPAMARKAEIEVQFPDGRKLAKALDVPAMAHIKRFAIQWLGAEGFILHGFEHGAEFGQKGDVSPSQPGLMAGGGGWLTLLGDAGVEAPLLAQVYTYPGDGSAVEIVVEAPVTAQTCGQDLLGQTVSSGGGANDTMDLTVAMPDCSAVGDFLVLNNLAQDTKLAAK